MRLRAFAIGATSALVLSLLVGAAQASPILGRAMPEGAIPLPDGGYALELKAETPGWYTDALHDKVIKARADGEGVPIPAGVELETSLAFTGIRPGAWILFPSWCTTNFVFGNPDTGPAYIGTAGHCGSAGQEVTLVAAPGVLMNIGSIVSSTNNGIGDDFALIEIYPEMVQYVNPSMSVVAGPTGTKSPAFGDAIVHTGHGAGVGTGGTPRAGVITWTGGAGSEASGYGWDGAATPGDSGSGVRAATGQAVGNLTHLVVGTNYLPAYIAGTNINRILALAGVPLATSSLIPNPLP